MITWNDVIKFASKGNPEPERRVEKSDHEWKDLLTVEQYKITRLKGYRTCRHRCPLSCP